MTFLSLEKLYLNSELNAAMSEDELQLIARYGDIQNFVEGDRIWPPVPSPSKQKFIKSLREVLSRLPSEEFDRVESEVAFVLENPEVNAFAMNVKAFPVVINPKSPAGPDNIRKLGLDFIVVFRQSYKLSPNALIGLIAHEIAHSFVDGNQYVEDESLVYDKAREWGFGRELDCEKHEKVQFNQL
jgi:hypothetical protein